MLNIEYYSILLKGNNNIPIYKIYVLRRHIFYYLVQTDLEFISQYTHVWTYCEFSLPTSLTGKW